MPLFLRRSLLVLVTLALFAALGCESVLDECDDDDNRCDGNIANECTRETPESRRTLTRTDCGSTRVCVKRMGIPECAPKG